MSNEFSQGWEAAYGTHVEMGLWSDEPIPCLTRFILELASWDCRTVLDVGCGDGRNLQSIAEAGFACVGVDMSRTALGRAAERLDGRAFLVHDDANSLRSVADHCVDAVTCLDVFGQIPDPSEMLQNFARVLVPGGFVAVNAFTLTDSEYGKGEEVGPHTFSYRDTLFRFFTEEGIKELFADWRIHVFDRMSWIDPPHGIFRPYEHTHDSWIILASPISVESDAVHGAEVP
ncbi:class I SAM-dependent methyltransferase [Streptomyces mirabilis]|uniref:class I SAM-dependent methyltransferase n=1 Tax=Streptomyces mirabilis TaxID=68239 RepID=UPI00372210A1